MVIISLGPVIDCVLDHFAILRDFFLKCRFDTATKENACFERICSHMKANEVTLAHLHIVRAVCIDFKHFLELFQESAHLIHMLHDELTEVLRKLMLRFVKDLVKGKPACTLVLLVLKTALLLTSLMLVHMRKQSYDS